MANKDGRINFLNDYIYNPARSLREFFTRPTVNYNQKIYFMGKVTTSKAQFNKEVKSRPYITYRRQFLATSTKRTSDVGFGCLLFYNFEYFLNILLLFRYD